MAFCLVRGGGEGRERIRQLEAHQVMLDRYLDFHYLCRVNPQLLPYFDDRAGRFAFDNHAATVKLTETLIKLDLGYEITLNAKQLCPNYFNRLDYVLFINRLISLSCEVSKPVYGLDIGTSQSCIYPLLCSRYICNFTAMLATDVVPEFVDEARCKIEQNHLDAVIHPVLVDRAQNSFDVVAQLPHDGTVFTMCNPPFYDSENELIRKSSFKKIPKEYTSGHCSELFTPGGDFRFILKLLNDSEKHKFDVSWFTTLVGNHSTLLELIPILKKANIVFGINRFKSGSRSVRWIIFWSYHLHLKPPYELFNYKNHYHKINNRLYCKSLRIVASKKRLEIIELLKSLPYLSFHLRGDELSIEFPGDVFSRSYRRSNNLRSDGSRYRFEIHFDENIHIWRSGLDFKIFERFHNLINSIG